ncbi:sulfotransferase family protein [Paeniglutamicibacter cryotolerans]|uniref:Sulfotransferase n=1 Tax=Paeniglutamicibacter cryotolerans TaxID=670079 RepID=A0A839QJI8_9MICC|nr:sulfotransferase [Paeniglutamicibacter cryotolerans]MBB2995987.1 hypothetical protein [Paeniglutamicibacter cryotolerans]
MTKSGLRSLTGTAKKVLPGGVQDGIRAGIQRFGTMTAPARMLPGFIIIGAQRSGTTSLYRLLSAHPDVVRPTASKGIGYFDLNYAKGQAWYQGHFPLSATARLATRPQAPQVFESSGYYAFHPLAADRIANDLPGVKLVMMLRDPVERAYSAHRHEFVRGFETEEFEPAIELEDSRLEGEVERLSVEPDYQSFHHRHHAYLCRGRYAEQIRRIRGAVGDDGLYLMDADDFFGDPSAEFQRLQAWLGLNNWIPEQIPAENAQPRSPMDPELRKRLRAYYEAPDNDLAVLMGRKPSWRRE